MKTICRFIFWLTGWKVVGDMPEGIDKCVIIVAPHTSGWDSWIGRMAFKIQGLEGKFLVKDSFFWFPLGHIIKTLGGIPINRKHANIVPLAVQCFNHNKRFILLMTPEGTRAWVKEWKRGFHYIALQANVPVVFGFLDYRKKEVGFLPVSPFKVTCDFKKDLMEIYEIYKAANLTAKYPEKFNLSAMYNK
jgi:1-acyl-sn-glycerol-3-phosphate acyltransferase